MASTIQRQAETPAAVRLYGAPQHSYEPVRVFGGFRLAIVVSYRTDDGWEEDYEFDWTRPVYATEAEALAAMAPVQARAA